MSRPLLGKRASIPSSNLDSFLRFTSPQIPSKFIPKCEIGNVNELWCPSGEERVKCFTLVDLWNCYDEWSAYVQYYVPYLSAIQIFTTPSAVNTFRNESDIETRDSSSDDMSSDDSERWDGGSSEEGDGVSVYQSCERLGYLYIQYFETLTPYKRVPFMDKLFRQYCQALMKTHLFYQYLSDLDQDDDNMEVYERRTLTGNDVVSLQAFGLATYRMQGDVWLSGKNGDDQEKLVSFASIADSWLKQLKIQHHDFHSLWESVIDKLFKLHNLPVATLVLKSEMMTIPSEK